MNVQALTTDRNKAPVRTFSLDLTTYHPCYGLIIPAAEGLVRFDHVVVSRYGIFIIRTCHHGGWIAGDARFPRWTSVYPGGARSHFPNPLLKGDALAQAMAAALDVPRRAVFPVIVFRGECELADILPENVVKSSPAGYIRSHRETLFSEEAVAELRLKLKLLQKKTSPGADPGE